MTGYLYWRKLVGIAAVLVIAVSLFTPVPVQADSGGIAISGSFYRHHFKVVPGESIMSPHINVIVYNNYQHAIDVKIIANTPPGVHIELTEELLTLSAKSSVTFPVKLRVEDYVVPGNYTVGIYAEVIPQPGTGIVITGSAEMRAQLAVFGEAGRVSIKTVTQEGEPFRGRIHLFHKLDNQLEPAGYSDTGELNERVIPGNYFVQVYWEGVEVAQREFALDADEDKDITLVVQTVFLEGFGVHPQFPENSRKIASARVSYNIKNVYVPLENASTMLRVYYKGKLLDELEMYAVPTLPLGTHSNRYTYIPPQGWKNGEYTFSISLFSGDQLYAETKEKALTVSSFNRFRDVAVGSTALAGLIMFFIIWKRKKCRDCRGTGLVDCTKCSGNGYIGSEDNLCKECRGTGKLVCQSCQGKKQKHA